jgi:MscS family membrane protein
VSVFVAGTALRLLRPWVRRTASAVDDQLLDIVVGPLRLLSGLAAFHLAWLTLGLSVPVQTVLRDAETALVIFAAAWGLFRVADVFARSFERRLARREEQGAAALVPMGRKTVKVLVAALAVLATLDSFGFDVTAVLAGLGVGGIAVALAAQKSVENLFGAVTLMSDRPVRPGDFCRFGDQVGTVEEIGLRSTRVRTLDRTLVTVPNAEFSTLKLENFTARDQIRFTTMLGLRYETSPDQMRHVLKEIRRLLLSHPRVTVDPARVRFVGFGAYSLDLEIFAYVDTTDWNEFLAIREDLLLRLMDVVAGSGTGFAFPSQTNYVAHDDGLDAERTKLAEEEIRELAEKHELPLPDYAEETRREFARSLEYPPPGSVLRRD